MKKQIFLLALGLMIVLGASRVNAVPAYSKPVTITQPDGTTVTIRLHGDEYLHYHTTVDGYSVVKDSRGYYVYAELDEQRQLKPTAVVAHDATARNSTELSYLRTTAKHLVPAMNETARQEKQAELARRAKARQAAQKREPQYDYHNFKGLIILVEFNDQTFTRMDIRDFIDDMVNKKNYSGYTDDEGMKQSFPGSVRDYFYENSDSLFDPVFDVKGPFTVDYSMYDPCVNDNRNSKANEICNAALDAADPYVNYQDYDGDGDGAVDLVFFIFAGNGANYGGNDSRLWWPHRSVVYSWNGYSLNYVFKDGIIIYDYASSVELYGYTAYPETVTIDGIGTICHEFSHVLGLPDFYDTNDKDNGYCITPNQWSVMSGGSYNEFSRYPIGYSLFERYAVGFATPTVIDGEGHFELENLATSNKGYRINSTDKNEFFFLENRQPDNKWNKYLPGSYNSYGQLTRQGHGMLVHRVDSSSAKVWQNNQVNSNENHPYYELLRAGGSTVNNGDGYDSGSDPFPGTKNVTMLNNETSPCNLMTWSGKETQWSIESIKESKSGIISFDIVDTHTLKSIALPETASLFEGLSVQLTPTRTPESVPCTIVWSSSDERVATVSNDGMVTGVAAGTAIITATANDTITASCKVTVEKATEIADIATLKSMEAGTTGSLVLKDAQVLMANGDNIFVRDETGAIVIANTGITASRNQLIKGSTLGTFELHDSVPYLMGDTRFDYNTAVELTDGPEAEPYRLRVAEVTDEYLADLVTITDAELKTMIYAGVRGVFITNDDARIRFLNAFGISSSELNLPSSYAGKQFDVTGILMTRMLNGKLVREIWPTQAVVESTVDGIETIRKADEGQAEVFTLDGRRTSGTATPGIYIVRQGSETRKIIIR